ncbi:MAG: hypothetical protein VCB24_00695 [Pseudomonas sp.]|uniref:hypothetical protein n=1 Tax=Pseudomonas sp. TaxID=306 RepID=UPI003982271D
MEVEDKVLKRIKKAFAHIPEVVAAPTVSEAMQALGEYNEKLSEAAKTAFAAMKDVRQ